MLSATTKNAAMAANGAVKRPGRKVPRTNPRAENAGRAAAPTAAGHHSGPPQLAWCAVTPYRTAVQPRYASMAQIVVAAHGTSSRAHLGQAVTVTWSVTRRRASRDPIQAAAPVTGTAKSSTAPSCRPAARRFHSGGAAMSLRYVVSQNSPITTGSSHAIALWRSSSRSSRSTARPGRRTAGRGREAAGALVAAVMTVPARGRRCTRARSACPRGPARRRGRRVRPACRGRRSCPRP